MQEALNKGMALELFFDLLFVFAVTQLSHRLPDHPTVGGTLGTLLSLVSGGRRQLS